MQCCLELACRVLLNRWSILSSLAAVQAAEQLTFLVVVVLVVQGRVLYLLLLASPIQ
jgi:hypothetical protein